MISFLCYKYKNVVVHVFFCLFSCSLQLVFTDRINQRVYVTLDEGETFDSYHVPFMPDKLAFQRGRAPNFKSYEDHLLGYDKGKREVSASETACTRSSPDY